MDSIDRNLERIRVGLRKRLVPASAIRPPLSTNVVVDEEVKRRLTAGPQKSITIEDQLKPELVAGVRNDENREPIDVDAGKDVWRRFKHLFRL